MQNINHVVIAGNLTRDPELKVTQSGTSVLSFGVAVNDSRRNRQTGEWEDYPNFVDCHVFGNQADALSRILRKGMKVTIDGKLRYSSWERDGQRRSKLEVIVNDVELPPRQQQPQSQQGYAQAQQQPVYGQQTQQMGNYPNTGQYGAQNGSQDVYDEDIPF